MVPAGEDPHVCVVVTNKEFSTVVHGQNPWSVVLKSSDEPNDLKKMITDELDEIWEQHGTWWVIPHKDVDAFKALVTNAAMEHKRINEAERAYKEARDTRGIPNKDSSATTCDSEVLEAIRTLRRLKKVEVANARKMREASLKIKGWCVANGASKVTIQSPTKSYTARLVETTRSSLDSAKVKALIGDDAYDDCCRTTKVETFHCN
jgi:hypothetical protein